MMKEPALHCFRGPRELTVHRVSLDTQEKEGLQSTLPETGRTWEVAFPPRYR